MRRVPSFGDACVAAPATTPRECPPLGKLTSMFTVPPRKSSLPLSCRYLPLPAAFTMVPYSCWQRGSHKGQASKRKSLWSYTKDIWQMIFCVHRVWTCWKFAHHSFKANSVEVLGPVVPQYVGSAVRAGCTPVLDLCHLVGHTDDENTDRQKGTLMFFDGGGLFCFE